MNKGSSHDSSAFSNTQLFDLLVECSGDLAEQGLFIVGDLAYGLTSFLLIPYEQQYVKGEEGKDRDVFNYYLSANWIWIEMCIWRVGDEMGNILAHTQKQRCQKEL